MDQEAWDEARESVNLANWFTEMVLSGRSQGFSLAVGVTILTTVIANADECDRESMLETVSLVLRANVGGVRL